MKTARDDSWLSAVEVQMAEAGVRSPPRSLATARLDAAEVTSAQSVFPDADIAIEGEPEGALEGAPVDAVAAEFAEMLRSWRRPRRRCRPRA
ncbi:MAG: hypothetical protein R3C58_05360 [Parvularculaceae bacterium]